MSKQNEFSGLVDQTRTRDLRGGSFGLRQRASMQSVSKSEDLPFSQVVLFFLLHVPLMLIFRAAPIIATFHSLVVLAFGFYCLMHDERPTRVFWVIAYIAGSEILWRGVGAAIFYEYGKYATLLLSVLLVFKFRLFAKATLWPWFFIALLVPGVMIVPEFNREMVATQLSGPITLGVVALAFSAMKFKRKDLQQFFVMLIAPNIALAFLIAFVMATQNITFNLGSNNQITGGIGSNQVSSALSLGAMSAFFCIFLFRESRWMRNLMIALILGMISMSVLTFSRSGLWTTVGALLSALPFLIRKRQQRLPVIGSLIALGLLGYFVLLPQLNNITGGELITRFSSFDTTHRDVLFQIDYHLFLANPIWGVGVGQSFRYHPIDAYGFVLQTHTEYGRLLAEHGIFGVLIIAILIGVTLFRIFSRRNSLSKVISTGFSSWALIYMLHSATRLVAPAFAFGLGAASFLEEENEKKEDKDDKNEQTTSRPHHFRR